MKYIFTLLILWALQFMLSCNNVDSTKLYKQRRNDTSKANKNIPLSERDLNVNAEDILKNFETWYSYTYYNIHLAQDFIGVDTDSRKINKIEFLTRLTTGSVVPLKIPVSNNVPIYRLYKLNNNNLDIQTTIKEAALHEMSNYKMEGKRLPNFNFTDLNGDIYNKTTTRKKIIVLKCWFIHCVACVQEFPELNKLVDEYKQNSNILFISLAMDSKQDLLSFLNKRVIKYAVVPGMKKYLEKELDINEFPTHIIIDKNGEIIKVVNSVEDLKPVLKRVIEKVFE